MDNTVNFKELKNVLLSHDFMLKELLDGLHNFQTIFELEELGITDNDFTLVNLIQRVPEQAIVSLEIPSTITHISDFPLAENFQLWIITTKIANHEYPYPMLFIWVGKTSGRIFVLPFVNNGQYVWTEITTYVPAYTDITYENGTVFSYRKIGKIVEWKYQSLYEAYPNQTTIGQLPTGFRPTDTTYLPLIKWLANTPQVGANGLRIDTAGVIAAVHYDSYVFGHGVFFVA